MISPPTFLLGSLITKKFLNLILLLSLLLFIFLPLVTHADGQPWRFEREGKSSGVQPIPSNTGSLENEFPIIVPPGRGSMTPDVKLIYNSQNNDNLSSFGYGWSLNTPYIERINRLGIDNLYDRFDFSSSLDGELWGATTTPGDGESGGGEMMLMSGGGEELFGFFSEEATTTIRSKLEGKSAEEKANIKGEEIAKIGYISRTSREDYDIEVVAIEPIEKGVQLFVRAWRKDDTQIGFGVDGSVDMERFRIINPPILVPDEKGDISQEWSGDGIEHTQNFREDPRESILQVLEQNLSVMRNIHDEDNIEVGKVGNTTSTFYSGSGDGAVNRAQESTWSSARDNTNGESYNYDDTGRHIQADIEYGNDFTVQRIFFPIDTSDLPDGDVISGATFSAYQGVIDGEGNRYVGLVQTSQANTSSLSTGDFDALTLNSPPEGTNSRVLCNSAGTYRDFTMNATGTAWISKTGYTKLGFRMAYDIDNTEPNARNYAWFKMSDETGSTMDPKLVVETVSSVPAYNFAARFENGDFRKYVYSDNAWVVTDKKGITYKFGTATTSRLDNPSNDTKAYRWMLDDVRDTHGNYIKYTYEKNLGQIYPSQIIYTGNGSTDGIFQVNFSRESRLDIATSSKTGFEVVSKYRINEINTKVNGVSVRTYNLAYATGTASRRSLLSSITETGQQEDASSSTSLPATYFTYTASTTGWQTASQNWNGQKTIEDQYDRFRTGDLNGDGFPDFYIKNDYDFDPDITKTYLNAGGVDMGNDAAEYHIPETILNNYADQGVRVIDVNGDGFLDVVKAKTGTTKTTYIHNATTSRWTASTTWMFPLDLVTSTGADTYARLLDINGDGLTDIVQSSSSPIVYINDGSGWATTTSWSIPIVFDFATRFEDINGDSLTDIFSNSSAYINNASGWYRDAGWDLPVGTVDEHNLDSGLRFADINGDGLIDGIRSYTTNDISLSSTAYINKGYGWQTNPGWALAVPFINKLTAPTPAIIDMGTRIVDINTDNLPDIYQADDNNLHTYYNKGRKTDLLSKVTTSHGASNSFIYSTDGDGVTPSTHASSTYITDIVKYVVTNDGLGHIATTTYTYENPQYYFNDSLDRRMAGFKKITATSTLPNGNIFKKITYYHQGNNNETAIGEYDDHFSKMGKPFRTEILNNSDIPIDTNIYKWEKVGLSNNRYFVKLSETISLRSEGDSTHRDRASAYLYDDVNGNLATSTDWGEVSANIGTGSFTDIGSDKATTTITYAASSTAYLSLPSVEKTINQSGATVRETRHYYDTLSAGNVGFGDETKTEFWKSGTSYASTTRSYNSPYGLVATSTDANGNATTYTYDTYNLKVSTTTNPLSHIDAYTYDYSSGKVKQTTDSNGRIYSTTYDPLDRVSTTTTPDPDTGSSVTKQVFTYTDSTSTPSSILETRYLNSATSTDIYTYLDGLNRKIQERKESEGINTYTIKDWIYNAQGTLQQESLPYFASSTAYSSATSTSYLLINYSYTEPLLRITTSANAVGTTTYAYGDWKVTVTDPNGEIKDFYKDAYDNLVNVVEYINSNVASTTYTWDLNKNLTNITDALGNIRNFTYDGMNRRLAAEDLHASGDSYFGTWNYAYDDVGNATSTTDAKSQVIQKTYDALNRVLTENYTGTAGTEITYSYDSCDNGKGRLCGATTTSASTNFNYSPIGSVKQETKTISGVNYTSSFGYDRLGNIASTTYPDNAQILYTYDDAGLLDKVKYREGSSGTFSNIISATDYSPMEQVKFRLYGNNASTTNIYDETKLYRLSRKVTGGIATTTIGGSGGGFAMLTTEEEYEPFKKFFADGNKKLPLALKNLFALETESPEIIEEITNVMPEIEVSSVDTETATSSLETLIETIVNTASAEEALLSTTTESEFLPSSEISSTTSEVDLVNPLLASLKYKTPDERITIKSEAIASVGQVLRTSREKYDFEIISIEPIEGGVQAFVRAWQKDGGQIGFGIDGSVEIERFRIFNPPILVPDSNGEIVQNWTDEKGIEGSRSLRVDPKEALLQVIEQNLSVMNNIHGEENIEKGKVGRTTSTFYAGGGDGQVSRNQETTWNSARNTADGETSDYTETGRYLTADIEFGNDFTVQRLFFPIDTSAIPESDTISSATFSAYQGVIDGEGDRYVGLIQTSQASTASLGTGDFDALTLNSPAEGTNARVYASGAGTYRNFVMNATGISWISTSGYTKLGLRMAYDIDNTTPTARNNAWFMMSDNTGTTQDPKLVVEHADGSVATSGNIQDLTYTYDAVGNITQIDDTSITNTLGVYTYQYDDLYRLATTTATSTGNNQNYTKVWNYNALGNISSSTDKGQYTYAGDTSTLYANPHAVTTLGGSTYTYDNNGNLTGNGTFTNEWDYRNRLATTTHSGLVEKYFYDHMDQRVKFENATSTMLYPFTFFATSTTGTTTKYIYANGEPVARIVASSTSNSILFYVHPDHLGSPAVSSDSAGRMAEIMNFHAFGETRIDDKVSSNNARKYINEIVDASTNLQYLNARYADNLRGQFLSEDPVFWEVGQTIDGISVLKYPQLQNSYSYAGNNPITQKDPTGRLIDTLADLGFIAYDSYRVADAYFNGGDVQAELGYLALDVAGAATPFATGFGAIARTAKIADNASNLNRLPDSAICLRGGSCSPESFVKGNGEPLKNGKVTNISVNSARNVGVKDLSQGLPHSKVGVTTVGQIRNAGGDVVSSPGRSPHHATLSGISPQQASSLFKSLNNLYKALSDFSKTLKKKNN